jgi:NAD(P)-dependent dehydrogenase (short-subunit alcohol dehydrogenase family)
MSKRLQDKVAVITGATSGIGEASATLFVEEGARVVLAGRDRDTGEVIARRLGPNAVFQRADVTREADVQALVQRARDQFGRLDCLFNNAGGPTRGTLETFTQDDFDHAMQLLVASVLFGIKHAAPIMKEQRGGSIINNSSVAALRSGQGDVLYSIAKAAVTHLTRLAGIELGPHGVRVNCISPGAVVTPIFWGGSQRARTLSDEENARKQAKLERNLAHATPLLRAGLPGDIAAAAVYLASDAGSFVNCHDLVVDGGRTALFHEKPAP